MSAKAAGGAPVGVADDEDEVVEEADGEVVGLVAVLVPELLLATADEGFCTEVEVLQLVAIKATAVVATSVQRFLNTAPWLIGPATSLPPGSATEYAKPSREGRPVVHSHLRHALAEAPAPLTCDNTPDTQKSALDPARHLRRPSHPAYCHPYI